jgi:ATP-dependent helicase/nuclease subunit A
MAWTKAQQSAIDKRKANILVSAAAGSGKTAVLTERVCKRVLGNSEEKAIDLDRFLIVTFTSAAAQEMKERIAAKISDYMEGFGQKPTFTKEDRKQVEHLERQLALLHKASISTMHSFCLKLIRNYFDELGVDPTIKVGNQAELEIMKREVLEDLLEEELEKEDNESFLSLADKYGGVSGLGPLMDILLKMHTFSQSTVFPKDWLQEKVNQLQNPAEQKIWEEGLLAEFKETIYSLNTLYQKAIYITKAPDGPSLYTELFEAESDALKELAQIQDLKAFAQELRSFSFARLPGKKQECSESQKEKVKKYRESAKKAVEGIKGSIAVLEDPVIEEKLSFAAADMIEMIRLIAAFEERYEEQKRDRGIVDYHDLEHMCLKLLIEKREVSGKIEIHYTWIAKELAEFYEEIYLDEYQDTNHVQEMIVTALLQAKEGGPTAFMVGDMKQSIYRFRLASPQIFASKYETWEKWMQTDQQESHPAEEACKKNVVIDLSQNFRSRENILAAANDLFEQLMSKEVGELEYDDAAKLKVGNLYDAEATEEVQKGLADAVEFHLLETDAQQEKTEEDVQEDEELEDLKNIELEAKMVASQIQDILAGKANPSHIFDKEEGTYRKVEPRDIVILLRSVKDKANVFEEALLNKGIDAYAETSSDFFKTQEIEVFLSLLQIIDNPRQDIPFITVLRSALVGVEMDELVEMRLSTQAEEEKNKQKSFFSSLLSYLESGKASQKLIAFYKELMVYRQMAATLGVEELIAMLLTQTRYYRYVGVLPSGIKKQANLRKLKTYARDFENSTPTGLFGFLQYIEKIKQSGILLEEAKLNGENDNVVRIMTVHKSKGLEFPIVFLSHLGKKFNDQDLKQSILLHDKLGIGPKYRDEKEGVSYQTIPFLAIRNQIQKENISEEMRVLYVALTRAKEKLILTGVVKNLTKQIEKWSLYATRETEALPPLGIKKLPTYLDWVGMSLFALKNVPDMRDQINETPTYLFEGSSTWAFKKWDKAQLQEGSSLEVQIENLHMQQLTEEISAARMDRREEIAKRLGYAYPYGYAVTMPNKVSVSDLKKVTYVPTEVEKQEKIPAFIDKQKGSKEGRMIHGAERGTLIHTVFEHLDLREHDSLEAIQLELQRLIEVKKLAPTILDVVDISQLASVAKSKYIARMKASKGVFKEKPFVYLLDANLVENHYPQEEKILLQGVVDTFFIEEDGLVLIDYKSDYIPLDQKEKGIERIKQRYTLQLELYAKALSDIMKMPIKEKVVYLYAINEWVSI